MEDLRDRLNAAALEPERSLDWDGTVRHATRRRRVRRAVIGAGTLAVALVVGVGGLLLLDDDGSDGGTVIVTQPPIVEDEVQLNERWSISPVPEGFTFEQIVVEEVPEVPPEIERPPEPELQRQIDMLIDQMPRAETTTARFRSDDGGELVLTETFVERMPSGPPLAVAVGPEGAIEEREIEFNDESAIVRYLPAGSGWDQSLSWEFSDDNWFAIVFDASVSFDDARAFAAAIQRAGSP